MRIQLPFNNGIASYATGLCTALAQLGQVDALDTLETFLDHPNNIVQGSALRGLPDERKARLVDSPDEALRIEGAFSLSRLARPEGIEMLAGFAEKRPQLDSQLRQSLVSRMIYEGKEAGRRRVAQMFSDEQDMEVKLFMAPSLPQEREAEVISFLEDCLGHRSPVIRHIAAGNIPSSLAGAALAARALVDEPDPVVRRALDKPRNKGLMQ